MDQDLFRAAMAKLGAAVCVVTSDGPAGRCGTTVTAVSSVTDTPATLLVCVNRTSASNPILRSNGVLCVNVLPWGQMDLAKTFAGMTQTPRGDRFDGVETRAMATGTPALADALVAFDCRISEMVEVGTHTIFLAEVCDIHLGDQPHGMVYFNRRYASVGLAEAV